MKVQVLILLSCIILAGCGGECKVASDCTARNCFQVSCVDKTCDYDPEPDCCGNDDCEAGENKCTCAKDCGSCKGIGEGYQFLSNFCDDADECVFGLDDESVKTESLNSGVLKSDAGTFEIDSTFNQPFNVKQDVVRIRITLKESDDDVKNIRVEKISLIGENQKRQKVTLGEMEFSRPVWKNGDDIIEDLILSPKTSDKESELRNAQLDILLSFLDAEGTDVKEQQDSITFKYPSLPFVYVQPDTEASCPNKKEWDDGNDGTEDNCSESTSFFVVHNPIPDACGNYKCDDAETRCSCAADCGPCSGKITEYLQTTCTGIGKCVAVKADDAAITPTSVFNEHKGSGFKIVSKISHDAPFDLSTSAFSFTFELTEFDPSKVGDVTITDVRILSGDAIVMEKKYNQKVTASGSTFSEKATFSMKEAQDDISLTAKIWYQYQVKSVSGEETVLTDKFNTFTVSLGKVTLLNPGVEYR